MRAPLQVLLTIGVLLGGIARAQAEDDSRAIIGKAIKAHGGEESLAKFKAGRLKTKGTVELFDGLPFTQDMTYLLPNRFKEVMELEANGQKITVATVYNGEKAWLEVNGKLQEVDEKLQAELKQVGHLMRVSRLTVLLEDASCKLSSLGEDKVNDRPAVGVRVECKGFRDISLWFDKDSGLLAKTERRALDATTGQEITEERIVAEYRKVEGLQSPLKVRVNRDGKKFMEAEVLEVKLLEQVDPKTFDRPASQ